MTDRKTLRGSDTNVQPKRDGRSTEQRYFAVCGEIDEERVIAGLVRLLRRGVKQTVPTPSQSEADAADDAAGHRQEE